MSTQTTIQLTTADGHVLAADLADPDGVPRGAVVVCHPHPQYGGNRHNAVVDAVFGALPPAGFRALRFDFRGEHGDGIAETADVVAAIDAITAGGSHDGPVAVVGYSFGALVALGTVDQRIGAIVAIAPPLARMPADGAPTVPVLVLAPRHDQYTTPDDVATVITRWPQATMEVVESADHFLAGHTAGVARRAIEWLSSCASADASG